MKVIKPLALFLIALTLNSALFVSTLTLASCDSQNGRSVAEFKQRLRVAEGDYAFGYHNLAGASSASQVTSQFGNPSKSEDLSDFYKCKVFYYDGKDDFGNRCLVRLQFVPMTNCQSGLSCYGLVAISTEAK